MIFRGVYNESFPDQRSNRKRLGGKFLYKIGILFCKKWEYVFTTSVKNMHKQLFILLPKFLVILKSSLVFNEAKTIDRQFRIRTKSDIVLRHRNRF